MRRKNTDTKNKNPFWHNDITTMLLRLLAVFVFMGIIDFAFYMIDKPYLGHISGPAESWCDTAESLVAWSEAAKAADHPSSLIFSRQNLKFYPRSEAQLANIARGGYVISEAQGTAQAVIIATGSEVELAVNAQAALAEQGISVNVVSMPSTNVFDRQDAAYKASVLPEGLPRVAVEAGVSDGWYKYVGLQGKVVGLDRFGESAPAELLFKEFGFTVENVAAAVKSVL